MRSLTKISLGLMVLSFAGLAGLSHFSYADDCKAKFNSITPEQWETFNIKGAGWVDATFPDNPSTPVDETISFGYLFGCHNCEEAIYDPTGLLVNSLDLNKIPTSWFMKVPEVCNGRGVVNIPPGGQNQVGIFTGQAGTFNPLMKEGYTIWAMNHPLPGFTGFPYLSFVEPPYHTHDFRNEYHATGQLLRDLTTAVFGNPIGFYALSQSRGTFSGNALIASDPGPFDGHVLGTGGNGYADVVMSHIDAYQNGQVPLTGLPLSETNDSQEINFIVGNMSIADPKYAGYILSGAT